MRYTSVATALLFSAVAFTSPALADAHVNVKLWDKAGNMDLSKDLGFGLGSHADMKNAIMGIEIDQAVIPAGKVTFDVTNTSKDMEHEMLISPLASNDAVLPYVAAENRVDEEASGDLGEVSELEPGKGGALSLDLKPGLYVLYCNVPGHFTSGMWTTIRVQ